MAESELLYQIGLTLIDGIGDVNAKNLLAYCGNASEVFNQKKEQLQNIPGIGYVLAKSVIKSKSVLEQAEKELRFIEKYKIEDIEDIEKELNNDEDLQKMEYPKQKAFYQLPTDYNTQSYDLNVDCYRRGDGRGNNKNVQKYYAKDVL